MLQSRSEQLIVRRNPETGQHDGLSNTHPLLRRLFSARGVSRSDELDYSLNNLPDPGLFKDMDKAVARLVQAIEKDQQILILGDYDADGATAAVVAILGLGLMGAKEVDFLVPNRFEYGYGLTPEFAKVTVEKDPALVITVDNGISSVEGIRILKDAAIDVIVTDHHLPGEVLPDATAIINPNQSDCSFPSGKLAGVGVMFYLLSALRTELCRQDFFVRTGLSAPNMAQFLDLVALGTVADVVPLDWINRKFVSQGIARIRQGKCRPGIRAIIRAAEKDLEEICSRDLGFIVAPRLNAAGRLDDISIGIQCLLTDEESVADGFAGKLNRMNIKRRKIEKEMQEKAVEITTGMEMEGGNSNGICLYDENWHQGVTGLVASRIKDRYFEPVIAFAPNRDELLTGSARSVPGLNIRDLLADMDTANPGLVNKFGGHAMAAGLTISKEDLDRFRAAFHETVKRHFENSPPSRQIITDGPLEIEYFTYQIAVMLRSAAPWGQHFPPPVFDNEFTVLSHRVVGGQHLMLSLKTRGRFINAIAFRALQPGQVPDLPERIRAVFQLDVDTYRGKKQLRLIVEHIEPVSSAVHPD